MEFQHLKPTRRYGKAQLYALNPDSPLVKTLKKLDDVLIKQAMQKATEEPIPAK